MDCEAIRTMPMGEIDYDSLGRRLAENKGRPAIINVNIGTTVKGAVDNLDRILRVLAREGYSRDQFHIHCDGALFAMMLPFVECGPRDLLLPSVSLSPVPPSPKCLPCLHPMHLP